MKEEIRPIYSELKGYLSATPKENEVWDETAINIANQLNGAIDELSQITDQKFDKFKIQAQNISWGNGFRSTLSVLDYRNRLSGLISRIQGEFFSEEQSVSAQPSTVINTNQTQSQSQSMVMVLELQEKILSEISKHEEGSKERGFLERMKLALPTIKTVMDVLSNALAIGQQFGLSPDIIRKLLGL